MASDQNRRFTDAALAASDDCIKVIGLDGTLQYMSEGGQRVMEVDDFSTVKGCPWPDFWQGQGNTVALSALDEARAGRSARFTGYANTFKGRRRYWDVKVSPILTDDGVVESILSVSRDITSLKDFEDQQTLLRNELSHRIKNILALVQAVASQSLREGEALAVSKRALLARIAALGRAHDLLTQANDTTTTLSAIVDTVAREQPEGRIIVAEGPAVTLSSKGALAIALTLHELATNAVKYGGLSQEGGQVAISWDIEPSAGDRRVALSWVERGGPPVSEPTRKGFGSLMIERALASYVGGQSEVHFPPTGLAFTMTAPLDGLATN